MARPTPAITAALEAFLTGDDEETSRLRAALATELTRRRPDLTPVLLGAARLARGRGLDLGRVLTAAACRAGCERLGAKHPGATIEVRVPPWAAVQIGFEQGSRHTRGTPPNVVEMSPDTFLGLASGATTWESVADAVRYSGAHAAEAARAFPL